MRYLCVAGVKDSTRTLILPEYRGKDVFPFSKAQPVSPKLPEGCGGPLARLHQARSAQSGNCGYDGGLMIIGTVKVAAGGTVTIGAVPGNFTEVNVTGIGIPNLPPVSNTYSLPQPLPTTKNCTAEVMAAAASAGTALVQWVQANPGKVTAALAEEAAWFQAGEVTLAEFLSLCLATLAAPEVLLIVGAALATAAAIAAVMAYMKCENGG